MLASGSLEDAEREEAAVFGFVDDVELALEPRTQTFAVRSAARLGYGDFGVNRKRIEAIRNAYSAVQG